MKPKIQLQKKTLNLRKGDWDYIEEQYSARGVQVSTVVRYLVSLHVDALKVGEMDLDELMAEIRV